MSALTLIMVFAGAFGAVSLILFARFVGDGVRWLSVRPRRDGLVLGSDMRGRGGVVEGVSACGRNLLVRVGPECWQALFVGSRNRAIHIGDNVRITGVEGLTLKVQPEQ